MERPAFAYEGSGSPLDDAANGGQSPAGPSSARSPSSASCTKEERERDDLYANVNSNNNSNDLLYPRSGQSLVDAFSTAMIFQATSVYMKVRRWLIFITHFKSRWGIPIICTKKPLYA